MTSVKLKAGDRVRLDALMVGEEWNDPIPVGTQGVVELVDGGGTAHVRWDNGRRLGLLQKDSYTRLASTPQYMECSTCRGLGLVLQHPEEEQAPT